MQTIGSVIDQLMVVNLKTWHWIDKQNEYGASEEARLIAADKIIPLNQQRNDLIDEIDIMLNESIQKGNNKSFLKHKLYKGE